MSDKDAGRVLRRQRSSTNCHATECIDDTRGRMSDEYLEIDTTQIVA